jgi:lipopolysaccharide heptosyltransferase II
MEIGTTSIKDFGKGIFESLISIQLSTFHKPASGLEYVKKILVFAYHGLGNFIMYTPALRQIRDRFPDARIDLQVGNNTGNEQVLAGSELFDNIYNLPYSAGARAWLKRAIDIRRTGYDLTINEFHSQSWQLSLLLAASGTGLRAGHVTSPGWPLKESRYSFAFNIPVGMREDEHEVERYLDLASAVGANGINLSTAKTFIHLTKSDREFASQFMSGLNMPPGTSILGVQPGTSLTMRWKQWPQDRYRHLIEMLLKANPDVQIVLFGLASEAAITHELARGLGPRVAATAGKTTVKQVAALIEACDALVCNDSGLMHAAVAVGTPVIAIYGPTDIRRTRPLGSRNRVIRHDLPCSPCFKLEGEESIHRCPHHDCLMTITPEEVFEAVDQALKAIAAASRISLSEVV